MDGTGTNPSWDEIFRPFRPALGPTDPPIQWVPGLSWGKVRPGRAADHSPTPLLVPRSLYKFDVILLDTWAG